jgi:hypothetical protein
MRLWWRHRARDRERGWDRDHGWRWQDGLSPAAQPLLAPAPRSAIYFPLVVLVAVVPGLYALNNWDLTPPGPWWGLRALAVLDGYVLDQVPAAAVIKPVVEAWAFRTVASQPPLYSWLEAIGLALSADRNPLASVLPSYVAGVVVVVLVFLHGRLWHGPALGLVAAVLTGFDRNLLLQMQQASPTTLALAGALGTLLSYGWYQRVASESPGGDAWHWRGPYFWAVIGGLSLGVALLSVGMFGLVSVVVVLLHRVYLNAGAPEVERGRERPRHWWIGWRDDLNVRAVGFALLAALLVSGPWHLWMIGRHGFDVIAALFAPLDMVTDDRPGLLVRLIRLAPATLPLGLYGAVRAVRLALADETEDRAIGGGAFWVLWLTVAALVPVFWPTGPWHLGGLFMLLPLNLLAAQAIVALAGRSIPVRTLNWLAPASAVSVAWWASSSLRGAISDVWQGRADSSTALGLHLALDLLIAAVFLTRRLEHWARRRDDRQRRVLAGFLLTVLAVTVASGSREVWFRHSETNDLLMLRTMILRRDREKPYTEVAVVGPEAFRQTTDGPIPGGRLRFILRTALPHLAQRDLPGTDDLLTLPEGQRLVILSGSTQRLPYPLQSHLKLEAIHPGRTGILDAFATAHEARPVRR